MRLKNMTAEQVANEVEREWQIFRMMLPGRLGEDIAKHLGYIASLRRQDFAANELLSPVTQKDLLFWMRW